MFPLPQRAVERGGFAVAAVVEVVADDAVAAAALGGHEEVLPLIQVAGRVWSSRLVYRTYSEYEGKENLVQLPVINCLRIRVLSIGP